jgi:hypothetical protein
MMLTGGIESAEGKSYCGETMAAGRGGTAAAASAAGRDAPFQDAANFVT